MEFFTAHPQCQAPSLTCRGRWEWAWMESMRENSRAGLKHRLNSSSKVCIWSILFLLEKIPGWGFSYGKIRWRLSVDMEIFREPFHKEKGYFFWMWIRWSPRNNGELPLGRKTDCFWERWIFNWREKRICMVCHDICFLMCTELNLKSYGGRAAD